MIDALLSAWELGRLEPVLAALRPQLSLDTVADLKRRVDETKLKNARLAMTAAEVAVAVAEALGSDVARALAAWARGNALAHLGRYAEARDAYQYAEAVYASSGAAWEVACLQINQVALLEEMADYQAALELAARARQACEALGDRARPLRAVLEMNEGVAYQQIGAFDAALAAFARGKAAFLALENPVQAARMDINQAYALLELNRHGEAHSLLVQARASLDAEGQAQEVARADLQLGILAYRRGHHQAALRHLEQARTGFEAIPNPGDVAVADLYRSMVYRQLNLLQETVDIAERAERQFDRDHTRWEQAVALITRGAALRRLQAWPEAARCLNCARSILSRRGVWSRVLELDVERAWLAWEEGRRVDAEDLAARMLREIDAAAHPTLATRLHLLLARAALDATRWQETPDDVEAALSNDATRWQDARHHVEAALSNDATRSQDARHHVEAALPNDATRWQDARHHVEAALSITAHRELSELRVSALHCAGQLEARAGRIDAAMSHLWSAIETVERLRDLLEVDELRIGFMDDKSELYADAARLSRQAGDVARRLLALNLVCCALAPRRAAGSSQAESSDATALQAQGRALREAWHWYQSRLSGLEAPESPRTAGADTGAKQDGGTTASAQQDGGATASARQDGGTTANAKQDGVSSEDVQQPGGQAAGNNHEGTEPQDEAAIHDKLRALEAELGELSRRLQIRRIDAESRTGSASVPMRPAPHDVPAADRARAYLERLRDRLDPDELLLQIDATDTTVHLIAVTKAEVRQIDTGAPVERIDRVLRAWRFQLERSAAGSDPAGTAPPPQLSRLYAGLIAPLEPWLSGVRRLYLLVPPTWHDLPAAALHDGRGWLVERLELVSLSSPEVLWSGVYMRHTAPAEAQALVMALSDAGRLGHALEEATAVAEALEGRWRVTLALEQQATLERLRAASAHCRLIHLASHAVHRPDNPFFSWVQLADARLTVADLYDMTLPRGPLMVLSACETGRGQPRAGGLLGMGRALLAAGASGLIVSLWKVPDQASASLMASVYRGLDEAGPRSAAAGLRRAQLEAIARGEPPFHWAGFLFVQG